MGLTSRRRPGFPPNLGEVPAAASIGGCPVAPARGVRHDVGMTVHEAASAAGTATTMVRVCGSREQAWGLLRRLSDGSDPAAWADRLADDVAGLRSAVSWLDAQWRPDGLLLLDGLVRRSDRRGRDDLAELADDSATAAAPHLSRLRRQVRAVHEMVAAELSAWEAGDLAAAKAGRVEQMTVLAQGGELRTTVSALAQTRTPVWSAVAQVLAGYLLLETGH